MISAGLGTQVIGSTLRPASYCGCFGFKPTVNALNREGCHDYQSQSCTGILAASLEDTWQVAYEIVTRVGGDAGTPGLVGPAQAPAAADHAGWCFSRQSVGARHPRMRRACMQEALQRLNNAGIEIVTRHENRQVAASNENWRCRDRAFAKINSWESRWFLRGCRDRDASQAQPQYAGPA